MNNDHPFNWPALLRQAHACDELARAMAHADQLIVGEEREWTVLSLATRYEYVERARTALHLSTVSVTDRQETAAQERTRRPIGR